MNLSLTKFVDGVQRWTTEHAVELVIGAGVAAMGAGIFAALLWKYISPWQGNH